jgi:hypothetical protein
MNGRVVRSGGRVDKKRYLQGFIDPGGRCAALARTRMDARQRVVCPTCATMRQKMSDRDRSFI